MSYQTKQKTLLQCKINAPQTEAISINKHVTRKHLFGIGTGKCGDVSDVMRAEETLRGKLMDGYELAMMPSTEEVVTVELDLKLDRIVSIVSRESCYIRILILGQISGGQWISTSLELLRDPGLTDSVDIEQILCEPQPNQRKIIYSIKLNIDRVELEIIHSC